jgi:hypothetical protein
MTIITAVNCQFTVVIYMLMTVQPPDFNDIIIRSRPLLHDEKIRRIQLTCSFQGFKFEAVKIL